MSNTTEATTAALLERVTIAPAHRGPSRAGATPVLTIARDGVVHAVVTVKGNEWAAYTATGETLVAGTSGDHTPAMSAAALHAVTAAARIREGELAVADAFGVTDLEATPAVVVGPVEVPEQRPASVNDVLATDPIGYARAAAVALGVEVGPAVDLSDVIPGVDTVYLVIGGTRSRGELVATPFVAVATRDEAGAWTAAADLVGKGGARVDSLPLL